MKKFSICFVMFVLLLFAQPVLAEDDLPYIEPTDCLIEVPQDREIECGVLVAPENYDKPDSAVVRLPYIYIHSTNPNPDPTPVLFTEGGPGYSSLGFVWTIGRSILLEDRDMIIFEQRGNRYANPALMCTYDEIADFDQERTPCLDRFQAQGIDITQYTTAVIAEDIESLRVALGIEKWNLYGASYSTRLMQVLMARHPEGIRSVILQAVNPLHETRYQHDPEHSMRVLQVMFDDCSSDPACAAAFPDLEEVLYKTVAGLNDVPLKFEISPSGFGSSFTFTLDGDALIDWMVGSAFYGPSVPHYDTAYLPLLIESANQRDIVVLQKWAERQIENDVFLSDDFSYGVYFAVNCQDDASSISAEQYQFQASEYPELDGFLRLYQEFQVCQLWELPAALQLAENPIASDIPTLALVGSYDPITPPEWAQAVAGNLSNAYYVEFPARGHSLDNVTDCAMEIKKSFLSNPLVNPDVSCLTAETPARYVLPGEVIVMPGFSQSWDDINFNDPRGNPVFEVVTGIAIVLCFLMIVFILVIELFVAFSKKEHKRKWERNNLSALLLAAVAAALSIAVVILMSLVSQADVPIQRVTLIFGFPIDYPFLIPLGVVVYLQIGITLVLMVVTVRIWRKVRGLVISRVILALSILAAVTFWPFYLRWDLLNILSQIVR